MSKAYAVDRSRASASWRWYILALVVSDATLLGLAFVLAAYVREVLDILPLQPNLDPMRYTLVAGASIPGMLVLLWLRQAYARQSLLSGPEEYTRIASGSTYGMLLVVAASYFYGSAPIVSRSWLLLVWVLSVALLTLGRFVLRRTARSFQRRGHFIRRILIAGANDQGLAIAEQLHGPSAQGTQVVGFLDDYLAPGTRVSTWNLPDQNGSVKQFRVMGHPREARALVQKHGTDLLIIVPGALSWDSQTMLSQFTDLAHAHLEVRLAPTQYDVTIATLQPAPLGYVPLLRIQPAPVDLIDVLLRRAVDSVLAIAMAVVLLPSFVWVVCAAALRGIRPIVQRRQVLGRGGTATTLMLLNPAVSQRLVLRGLPSTIAVMSGKLSLVGPRPVPVEEQVKHERWDTLLLSVQPGLTGPWRLIGEDAPEAERLLTDIWWIRNWTIWQHLFVLFQTARVVWRQSSGTGDLRRWEGRSTKVRHTAATPRG